MDPNKSLLGEIVKLIESNTTVLPKNANQNSFEATGKGQGMKSGTWSILEHNRFMQGVILHPHGPWDLIAEHVGTRSTRQTRAHAQKYLEKIRRHLRGLLRGESFPRPSTALGGVGNTAAATGAAAVGTAADGDCDGWDEELENVFARFSDTDLIDIVLVEEEEDRDTDGGP